MINMVKALASSYNIYLGYVGLFSSSLFLLIRITLFVGETVWVENT